jgi:hypothetical protein
MSNLGIHTLLLSLLGIHSALTHHEFMGMIEIVRALGNSYRLAALEPGSSFLYGRFAFNFCRVVVSCVAR